MRSLPIMLALTCALAARGQVHTEKIEYKHGDTVLEGHLAYDQSIQGKRPGVLIVHQWKGLTDYEKKRAEMLAKLGYIAFAVDIYGKGIRPKDNQEAAAEAGKYKQNRELLPSRAAARLAVPRTRKFIDSERIAAIGYCVGGTDVKQRARSRGEIDRAADVYAV